MPTPQLKKQLLLHHLNQKINNNIEANLRINLQNFFETLKNRVIAELEKYYDKDFMFQGQMDLILAPIHEAHREYYELLLESNLAMYQRGMNQGERLYNLAEQTRESFKSSKSPFDFNRRELFGTLAFSEDYLTDYTFTASQKTINRVDSEINQILSDGYKDGWGVKDVRNRIIERYDQFKGWEANRIARTEMQTAHNMGVMRTYFDLEVDFIQWRSAHDMRVRGLKRTDKADHMKLDGEITRLGSKFSNGLQFPGDKTGKIEEWINCRCSAIPFLLPPGKEAPSFTPFRETDLVTVHEPFYDELLMTETGNELGWLNYKKVLQGKTDVSDFVPSHPNGDLIDVHDLVFNSSKQMYMITTFNPKVKKNPATGEFEYKGLKPDYEDSPFIFFKKESIHEHNVQLAQQVLGVEIDAEPVTTESEPEDVEPSFPITPIDEPIDVSELTYSDTGVYLVQSFQWDYDETTDKYYYKGIELDIYISHSGTPLYGKIPKEIIDQHNAQFETLTTIPDKEYIDTTNLTHIGESTYYVTPSEGLIKINGKYYFKGLEVTDINSSGSIGKIPGSDIIEHNALLMGKPFNPENLEYSNLSTMQGMYVVEPELYGDAKYDPQTGNYVLTEYNLVFDFYDPQTELGYLKPDTIKEHNLKLITGGKKFIDTIQLTQSSAYKGYQIDANDPDVAYDPDTDKHYYKGLEFYSWYGDYGVILESHIVVHNAEVNNTPIPNADPNIPEIINPDELYELETSTSEKSYFVSKYDGAVYDADNHKWTWKGDTWIGNEYGFYVMPSEIDAHNQEITEDFEYIDPNLLVESDGKYYIDEDEGAVYIGDGKWEWKGAVWLGDSGHFDLTKEQLQAHNEFAPKPIIHQSVPTSASSSSDLTVAEVKEQMISTIGMEQDGDLYKVDPNSEYFEERSDGYYYKGIKLDVMHYSTGATFWLSKYDINPHNKKAVYGQLPTNNQITSKLTQSEQVEWFDLMSEIDYIIEGQTKLGSPDIVKSGLLDDLDDYLPRFNELKKKALAFTPENWIDINDLYYDDSLDEYVVGNVYDLVYYPSEGVYKYKGLVMGSYELTATGSFDKGYMTKEQIEAHNSKVPSQYITKEYIDINNLIDNGYGEYTVSSADGLEYKEDTDTWYYKGLEVDTYDVDQDIGYIDPDEIEEHNKNLPENVYTKSTIYFSDLQFVDSGHHAGEYKIKKTDPGVELTDYENTMYYKGLKVLNYQKHSGYGYLTQAQIDAHNNQQPQGEFIDATVLPYDSYEDEFDILKTEVVYNPNTHQYEFKGMKIDESKYVEADIFIQVPASDINEHNLQFTNPSNVTDDDGTLTYHKIDQLKTDDDGDYMFSNDDDDMNDFNPNDITNDGETYYWKGIPMDYYDGGGYGYIEEDTMEQYMLDNDITGELTYEDLEKLEEFETGDGYYEFEVDDWHKVDFKYNENTGEWEFKGIEIFDYDEDYGTVIIDKDKVEEYQQYHSITRVSGFTGGNADAKPNNNVHNVRENYLLEQKIINGEKYVIDENGREWVVDNNEHYERAQDNAQATVEPSYDRYQRNAGEHWGHYGHQPISNMIYHNPNRHTSDGASWDEFTDLMENEAIPLLNRMKEKLLIMYDETEDQYTRHTAKIRYNSMLEQFKVIADSISDTDARETLYEIMELDHIIARAPELLQDTCFTRYGHFDESMCQIGGIFDFDGFLSLSYGDATTDPSSTDHFQDKCSRWKMTVLAPKGTPGFRLNYFFHALTSEREWCIPRNMRFEVLEYNLEGTDETQTDCMQQGYKRKKVTIRLILD